MDIYKRLTLSFVHIHAARGIMWTGIAWFDGSSPFWFATLATYMEYGVNGSEILPIETTQTTKHSLSHPLWQSVK